MRLEVQAALVRGELSRQKGEMDFNKLTLKTQEAVAASMDQALRQGNPEVYPEHLILALLDQELPQTLVERAGGLGRRPAGEGPGGAGHQAGGPGDRRPAAARLRRFRAGPSTRPRRR